MTDCMALFYWSVQDGGVNVREINPCFNAMMSALQTHLQQSFSKNMSRQALSVRGHEYSFSEVCAYVSSYQDALSKTEISKVAVYGDRSLASYVGVIASVFTGQTFVPFNPAFPDSQNRNIIALSDARAIMFDAGSWSAIRLILSELETAFTLITIDDEASDIMAIRQDAQNAGHDLHVLSPLDDAQAKVTVESSESDILYIMYTSGTTGTPKGVPISHGNVMHYINGLNDLLDIGADDRFTQLFDLTFDLSMHDIFLTWSVGGCLCVPDRMELIAPKKYIERERITVWFSVPSVLAMMAKLRLLEDGAYPDIRYGLFCGEALPQDLASAWIGAAPNSVVINLYGPTEATIAFTEFQVNRKDCADAAYKNGVIPIGKVFGDNEACIISEDEHIISDIGEAGELCLSGPQITEGYINNPEQNAARFFVDEQTKIRWYKTGDRVYEDNALGYIYLGRMDHQVKIRGYRVELAEIENELRAASGSAHVAAIAWPVDEALRAEGVVAFLVAPTVDIDAIHQKCAENLVDYKRPSSLYILDALPLNANGKVDRNALKQYLTEQT